MACLVATSGVKVSDIKAWVANVMHKHNVFISQGESGLPPEYRKTRQDRPSAIYKLLADAYRGEWGEKRLDAIGKAMQLWRGPGQHDGLDFNRLKRHPREIKGRWELPEALFGVASLLKTNLAKLRKLLQIEEDLEELPGAWEVIEELEADKENLAGKIEDMQVETVQLKKKLKNKTDAHATSSKRRKANNCAVTEARRDERNNMKQALSAAKDKMKESLRLEAAAQLEERTAVERAELHNKLKASDEILDTRRKEVNVARASLGPEQHAEKERDSATRQVTKLEKELEELHGSRWRNPRTRNLMWTTDLVRRRARRWR